MYLTWDRVELSGWPRAGMVTCWVTPVKPLLLG